jgi:hypothetical protein
MACSRVNFTFTFNLGCTKLHSNISKIWKLPECGDTFFHAYDINGNKIIYIWLKFHLLSVNSFKYSVLLDPVIFGSCILLVVLSYMILCTYEQNQLESNKRKRQGRNVSERQKEGHKQLKRKSNVQCYKG